MPRSVYHSHWIPVPVYGFRAAFEMNPAGHVRLTDPGAVGRWLLPQHTPEPGYTLCLHNERKFLPAAKIAETFGLKNTFFKGWVKKATACAKSKNSQEYAAYAVKHCLWRLLLDAEEEDMDNILRVMAKGCPWEQGRVGGDARGADPVLGF